jgi:hypothetical protein
MIFSNKLVFYGEGLLVPRPKFKLEDHPLSFARDYLFNIVAVTLHLSLLSLLPNCLSVEALRGINTILEKWCLLGCYAVWFLKEPTFRRNLAPPSSG